MQKSVREVIGDVLGLAPEGIAEDLSMQNAEGWDSLKHMEIVASLEDEFEITFTADEIVSITSLPAINSTLREKGIAA
ncbi:MAG TPA: acyl carrier protein [Thermoguttaceae bacterium]|nr:acyl carrier protein [Thermoguttaceae bacterium]